MSSSDDRRRPRVAGQRRRHGRPVHPVAPGLASAAPPDPDALDEDVDRPTAATGPGDVAPAGPGWAARLVEHRTPVVALVVALLAFAAVALVTSTGTADRERDARSATAAATAALEQLLSYDYRTLDQQTSQNAALLAGPFRDEYQQTMRTTIAPVAEKEHAVVRARTHEAGVMAQTDDTVTVELFLDQAKSSTSDKEPSVDQNRVIATMRKVGDDWLVAQLQAF